MLIDADCVTMNSLITIAAASIRIQTPSTATCAVIGTNSVVTVLVTVTIISITLNNICEIMMCLILFK